jgi:putative flippase GtrA
MKYEVARFIVIGCLTVLLDFSLYSGGLVVGLSAPLAKAGGFCAGSIFAYFANRRITFQVGDTQHRVAAFVMVYLTGLGANVGINELIMIVLAEQVYHYEVAFLISTLCSAALNFAGMKFIVFRKKISDEVSL